LVVVLAHGLGASFACGAAVCRVVACLSELGQRHRSGGREPGALFGSNGGEAGVAVGAVLVGERGPAGAAGGR